MSKIGVKAVDEQGQADQMQPWACGGAERSFDKLRETLSERIISAFDMIGLSTFFANCLVLVIGQHGPVRLPDMLRTMRHFIAFKNHISEPPQVISLRPSVAKAITLARGRAECDPNSNGLFMTSALVGHLPWA